MVDEIKIRFWIFFIFMGILGGLILSMISSVIYKDFIQRIFLAFCILLFFIIGFYAKKIDKFIYIKIKKGLKKGFKDDKSKGIKGIKLR